MIPSCSSLPIQTSDQSLVDSRRTLPLHFNAASKLKSVASVPNLTSLKSSTPSNETKVSTPGNSTHFVYSDAISSALQSIWVSQSSEEINPSLIDFSDENESYNLADLDPLKQTDSSSTLIDKLDEVDFSISNDVSPTSEYPITPDMEPSIPYPIKLRFKFKACTDLKPLSLLVERLRNQCYVNQTSLDDLIYCKHVLRLTSQHIKQREIPVTLYVFTDSSKEPICLTGINLQTTGSQILKLLLETVPFDYDQSILKLRSCDEYLHNDAALADIEYIYNCIYSMKKIQFVLSKKPVRKLLQKPCDSSFEQFCLSEREKYFKTIEKTKTSQTTTAISNKIKQTTALNQNNISFTSDYLWIEEFRHKIELKFEKIQQSLNSLINPKSPEIPAKQQIEWIKELLGYCKTIQIICSNIRSTTFIDKQLQLNLYTIRLVQQPQNNHDKSFAIEPPQTLLIDLILGLMKYIHTYCQTFLIPYEVEAYNDEIGSIDLQQLKFSPKSRSMTLRPATNSSKLFSVHIDTLYLIPSNVTTVRVLVRLCYGNKIKATQMTKLMSFVRHNFQENSFQINFNQQLVFDDAFLCVLEREALLLFEIYASFMDDTDPSVTSLTSEVFDGVSMRLIGWCSQALFDHQHRLISGEHYLGIIDASTTARTGFYSLRNVTDRNCSKLAISFINQSLFLTDIQIRDDVDIKNFNDLSSDKQEDLCRLVDGPNLLLIDHSVIATNNTNTRLDNSKQRLSPEAPPDNDFGFSDEYHSLWSYRHYLIQKSNALPKLIKSRSLWDYPSLIDIYGLVDKISQCRQLEEVESFELLLPAFPDMYIRSFAYRSLISCIKSDELLIYLPQLLQMVKFDYNYSSPIIEYLLEQCIKDYRIAHTMYWYLRQLLLTEKVHFVRYYYMFMSLLYVVDDDFRSELENEYDVCVHLRKIGFELKSNKLNKGSYLIKQLEMLNENFFQSGRRSCRLPCQFSFITNNVDFKFCHVYKSLTSPVKLVFDSVSLSSEKYESIYKTGDDLRQDQFVLQVLNFMDRIWKSNNIDFRLSLFNVVPTEERCGFIQIVTDSKTLMDIEKILGTLKGSFGASALYNWLRSNNPNEKDFQLALENLTYSCAGYCIATYVLGIGDRHNENIMVKKSGHLFHIDFGKYLGDKQKFGRFNRDRVPFIFTKQMLYAMSDGGTSNDTMHRFVDLCCDAFDILRRNSSLLLSLLSHLCPSNVSNLNYDAVRFVYDRLAPSKNYAESTEHFTELIVDSLNSTWPQWNGLIHKIAKTNNPNESESSISNDALLSFVPKTCSIATDEKIISAQVIDYNNRAQRQKFYLYKIKVVRTNVSYHYRTYNEFIEFYESLIKQFPSIVFDLQPTDEIEDNIIAQKRMKTMNDIFESLFHLSNVVTESALVCTFFHTIPRDQQKNDTKEKSNGDSTSRFINVTEIDHQSKIRLQLLYEKGKLFIMVRHANNLPLINGNEPRPYCKCYLLPGEFKSTKRKGKTAISRNPIFNDTFIYEMELVEIQKRILRVGVWNYVLNASNSALGTFDILLSEIDWSKKYENDYSFTCHDL